jgi:hypothetical protein
MANPIFALVKSLFEPAAKLVDDLTLSKEEKMGFQAALDQLEIGVTTQLIGLILELEKMKANIIIAEAQSGSWLTQNWRPMIMMMFGYIIFNNYVLNPYFDIPMLVIEKDMWTLLKLGLGGYIGGRSIEKAVSVWKNGRKVD